MFVVASSVGVYSLVNCYSLAAKDRLMLVGGQRTIHYL